MTRARAMRVAATYGPFLVVVLTVALLASPTANDHFQFWWAGHLVATGRSPYEPAAWSAALAYGQAVGAVAQNCAVPDASACLWLYPPWTAWLFAPTGALEPQAGIALQRAGLVAALAIGAALALRMARATAAATGPLVIGVAASAPFVREVVTGHFEGLLLIGLALLAAGLRDRRTMPIAAGALLLSLKPHLFLALAPLVVAWLIWTRAYRAFAVTGAALAALAIAGFASDPLAWPALLGRAAVKRELAGATTWSFASAIGGGAAPLLAGAIVVVAVAAALLAWRRSAPHDRPLLLVATGAAVSLAVAPYSQSYDSLVLLPAIALACGRLRGAVAVSAAVLMVGLTWAAYGLELAGDPRPFAAALPCAALVAVALGAGRTTAAIAAPSRAYP